jgi:hypothetical protein
MPITIALTIAMAACSPTPGALPPETVIRLSVKPMAEPQPALRYMLLPDLKEMSPGNPIEGYLQCFMNPDFVAEKGVLGKAALRQADRAARMDKPDWQSLHKAKAEGIASIGSLVPDLAPFRQLADGLKERFRSEVAKGRFDDAILTAKTLFALSRHLDESMTIISALTAMTIVQQNIVLLEEMVVDSDCPNLYWALTHLPSPLISVERGMEGERMMLESVMRYIVDDTNPMDPAEARKRLEGLIRGRDFEDKPSKEKTQAWLDARTKNPVWLVNARSRLVDYGIPEERLMKFPIEQIILLDEKREFEVRRDQVMKLMNLPTWQVEEQLSKIKTDKEKPLLATLLPAFKSIRRVQGRLEQRIALLRHVEALRLYAADHRGQLPEKLSDITVPLPVDPFTGKPFRYTLEGVTAHLRGNPPVGAENDPAANIHYELTIKIQ